MFEKLEKQHDNFYFVFRLLVGLLFLQHGIQKIFGGFGGSQVELFSLFGAAGIIELVGGILITIGLFTRITAVISGLEMLVAFFYAHVPGNSIVPIMNGGEGALLFFAAFLILAVHGAKKWGLDTASE